MVFTDLEIIRAFLGIRTKVLQSDMDGFHRNFPKEEKLIDIGFLNRGFSQEFGSISYWTVWIWIFGFSGYLDISINQLPIQTYNHRQSPAIGTILYRHERLHLAFAKM